MYAGSEIPLGLGLPLLAFLLYKLFKSDKPKSLWLLMVSFLPMRPSHGLTHLFPGVETPPDPAHSDALPTEVDRRPPKPLPEGTRRKNQGH